MNIGVVGTHQQVLTCGVVGACEVHGLLAAFRDGVGRKNHVYLTGVEHVFAVSGGGFDELNLLFGIAELAGDVACHLHVETGVGVAVLVAEAGLVYFDADADLMVAVCAGATGEDAGQSEGCCCGECREPT